MTGINRNIVECKFQSERMMTKTLFLVLIETLWNVNTQINHAFKQVRQVLIETLWNVN